MSCIIRRKARPSLITGNNKVISWNEIHWSIHCKSRLIKKYVAEPHCTLELHWYNICGFFVKKAQLRSISFMGAQICTFGMAENFVFWNLHRCLGIFYGWLASLAALCPLCWKNEPTRFYLYFCFRNIHLENKS